VQTFPRYSLMISRYVVLTCLLIVGSSMVAACQPLVGGTCVYRHHLGTTQVQARDGEPLCGFFTPAEGSVSRGEIWQGRCLDIPTGDTCQAGMTYPARLAVIEEGSCVPFRLELLSDGVGMRGVTLDFDDDGRETDQSRAIVEQIAVTFKSLQVDWPDCQLLICGQAQGAQSAEYRWGVARHYEARLQSQLKQWDIADERIKVISGELPPTLMRDPQANNGVEVFFQLR